MKNIAVFASGSGSNFAAIVHSVKKNKIADAKIALLICDNPKAYVLERAKKYGIKSVLIQLKDFKNKFDYERKILEELRKADIELIVLAGYMKIVTQVLLEVFENKILNIHPALLPSFKGACAIKDAYDYKVKITGVTVHFVDKETDHGPIVIQREVPIEENDTLQALQKKIHSIEHEIYPKAINLFLQGRLRVVGRRVEIL